MKAFYTIDEVSDLTGIGRTTLYKFMKTGRLKTLKVGRRTYVRAGALERFVDSFGTGQWSVTTSSVPYRSRHRLTPLQ